MTINIEELYNKYAAMVWRRCRWLLNDDENAWEATQEVFLEILKMKHKIKIKYPSTLLYTIATQKCLRLINKEKQIGNRESDAILSLIASSENIENQIIINDLLDRLFKREKPSTKVMAVLHYVDKLTYKQIAKEMGMSAAGVSWRLRKLKSQIKDSDMEDL